MEKKTNFSMIQNASHELVLDFLHEDKNTVCILGWKLLMFEDWANQKKKRIKREDAQTSNRWVMGTLTGRHGLWNPRLEGAIVSLLSVVPT
jgi:hypothetical protein